MGRTAWVSLFLAMLAGSGCELTRQSRRPVTPPPLGDFRPTEIDYVDTDAFDALLEVALLNRDPAIVVRTTNTKPDWTGRLNGWIAAWNMGKKVEVGPRLFRGQIPVTANIDAEAIREFRLLVTSVVDRAESASQAGVAWWKEERIRSRRVEMLRPYSLRFHMCDEGQIHVIFFHGDYAKHHPQFVATLTDDVEGGWSRRMECSWRKKNRQQSVSEIDETR